MSSTEERIDALEERVLELEEENQKKDDRIDELENSLDFIRETVFTLEDNVYGEYDSMGADAVVAEQGGLFDRMDDADERMDAIERGEIDPGEVVANSSASVDPSDLLPLHNMYLSATRLEADAHDLSNNQEIAARLFPHLPEYAFSNEGNMILPSTKVKDILKREIATPELKKRLDVEDPNPNTVRRAMEFVGKFGKDIMEFNTEEKMNRIVIDRSSWVEYTENVTEIMTNDRTVNTADDAVEVEDTAEEGVEQVENELDQLTQDSDYGVVSTDGGTTVNRE